MLKNEKRFELPRATSLGIEEAGAPLPGGETDAERSARVGRIAGANRAGTRRAIGTLAGNIGTSGPLFATLAARMRAGGSSRTGAQVAESDARERQRRTFEEFQRRSQMLSAGNLALRGQGQGFGQDLADRRFDFSRMQFGAQQGLANRRFGLDRFQLLDALRNRDALRLDQLEQRRRASEDYRELARGGAPLLGGR